MADRKRRCAGCGRLHAPKDLKAYMVEVSRGGRTPYFWAERLLCKRCMPTPGKAKYGGDPKHWPKDKEQV